MRGGEIVLAKGYGFADRERRVPATPDTIYSIASITKPLVAATVLDLVTAATLGLDDPVRKYLPEYDTHGRSITLRHLLSHTSGIPDYPGLKSFAEKLPEGRDAIIRVFEAAPLDFEPGTRWRYSNSNYYVLSAVIQKVTGRPWSDVIRERAVALGLHHTAECPPAMEGEGIARAYEVDEGTVVGVRPPAHGPDAAGGLCSTVMDLARWVRACARGRAQAWASMTARFVFPDGRQSFYGLGMFVARLFGHRAVGHDGGIPGYSGHLSYFPDDDLVVVLLANTHGSLPMDLGASVERAALGVPEPGNAERAITATQAAPFEGTYDAPTLDARIRVHHQGDRLHATAVTANGEVPLPELRWQGGNIFTIPETRSVFTFVPGEGGAAAIRLDAGWQSDDCPRLP